MGKRTISIVGMLVSANIFAAPIIPGNLLIQTNERVYEYDGALQLQQTINVERPAGTCCNYARDIAVDANGNMYVYNGTFEPYMSKYDSTTGNWNHQQYSGWGTVNNVSYGGIDVFGNTVFVTDMSTANSGEPNGIVAFTETGPVRFAENIEPIDLTVGLDGLLYALSPGGSPGGRHVTVYDPNSFNIVNEISLSNIFGHEEHRTIAVDANGDIFIADWDGEVHHVGANGQLVQTIMPECNWLGRNIHCEFIDIDIAADGSIALGTRFGEVFLTDRSFSSMQTFDVGTGNIFVEFAAVSLSEPELLVLSLLVAGLAVRKRNHH